MIKSLQQKKYRDSEGLFLVEGLKSVSEAIESRADLRLLVYCGEATDLPFTLPQGSIQCSERELKQLSALKQPNRVLAVCAKPNFASSKKTDSFRFALDAVSDPGNLGTIIRLCDWFGLEELICGRGCVDPFNPKTVQASMGSIFRVHVRQVDLEKWLRDEAAECSIAAADMEGESLYDLNSPRPQVVILGSEAHGLSDPLRRMVNRKVSIPRVGRAESLNVASAAAIIAGHLLQPSNKQ